MFRSLLVFYILSPIIFIVAWILLPFVSTLSYCFYHEMYKGYLRKGMTLSNYAKSELSKIQWYLVRFLFNQVIMTAVDIGTDVYQAYEYYFRYNYKNEWLNNHFINMEPTIFGTIIQLIQISLRIWCLHKNAIRSNLYSICKYFFSDNPIWGSMTLIFIFLPMIVSGIMKSLTWIFKTKEKASYDYDVTKVIWIRILE